MHYTVTQLDGEWYIVFDPIHADANSLPTVLSGYTSRRAATSAAELFA